MAPRALCQALDIWTPCTNHWNPHPNMGAGLSFWVAGEYLHGVLWEQCWGFLIISTSTDSSWRVILLWLLGWAPAIAALILLKAGLYLLPGDLRNLFSFLSFFFFFMVTRMLHWASREKKFEVKPGSSTGRIRGKGNGRQRLRRKKGNIPSVASRPGWSFITGCLSAPSVGLGLPVLRWRVCCVSGEVVSVCKTN